MKGKDLISIVHSKAQQSRHYAHAFASYLASKSQIVNDIYEIALQSYKEGGAVDETGTLNSDIITNDLINIPVWIRPLTINGIEGDYDCVCITFKHYIHAINGKLASDSPNEAEVPLSYGRLSISFGEYLEFEGFNLAPLNSGVATTLQYNIPMAIQIGERVYNKGDVIEFSKNDLDDVCVIPSHTLPIIKFSILESLQGQVQSVVSCNSTVAIFEALASKDNPTVSDISDAIKQAVGNFNGYEEYIDQDMLNAAKNVSLSGSERIHQLVSLMNDRITENESDLTNDIYYDEDIKMLFNSQNYTGMTPVAMFNAANVSSTIKNVFMTTGAIIKAAVKVVLNAAKSIFKAIGRLWRKYVTPIYKSKDFVKTEYADSDTHVDLPVFAVGNQAEGIQFSDLDLVTPTLKMFNEIGSIEGKFNPGGLRHELDKDFNLFMFYDDPDDQGVASFEVKRAIYQKNVANMSLSKGSDGDYRQYLFPDMQIKSQLQTTSFMTSSDDEVSYYEDCVGMRGTNGVLKVLYDDRTYRVPPEYVPGESVNTNLPTSIFQKRLEYKLILNEETGYYYHAWAKYRFTWSGGRLVMRGVRADGTLSHVLLDIISEVGISGYDVLSCPSKTELGKAIDMPDGLSCEIPSGYFPYLDNDPIDDFVLTACFSYPFSSCGLHVRVVLHQDKLEVVVLPPTQYRHILGSNGLVTFQAPGSMVITPVIIYDVDFPIRVNEDGTITNLNDGSIITSSDYRTVTLPGIGSKELACNTWDLQDKEHFSFAERGFRWDITVLFRPSVCDEAIASFSIQANCDRGSFYSVWEDEHYSWLFDSDAGSIQTIKNDPLYYENGNVKFLWAKNLNFIFYPPTVSMLNEDTLTSLYKEINCPVDDGTALVIKNNFFSMQILNRDGLIRSQCYLTPVVNSILYDQTGTSRLGLSSDGFITWTHPNGHTQIAYDEETAHLIFSDLFSSTAEVRNTYDEEKGDVDAYNDLVCSKRLTDLYAWCLSNPDLRVEEYISKYIKQRSFYMFTGVESFVEGEVNNLSFYQLLWNDGESARSDAAINLIRDVLILAITNKPNVMRAMYYLTGTFPEFIPYSIGDRLQMPRWHVSNDQDIQGYIEKVCASVLIVAAVVASCILLKQAAKKTRRFFDKHRRKSEAKLFNAQSRTRAADSQLESKKKELSDLDDWIKTETDPEVLADLKSMRKELIADKKDLSKTFSKIAKQEVSQALKTKRWNAVCGWLGANATAVVALDALTGDEASSKSKQEEMIQQCSNDDVTVDTTDLSTKDDVSALHDNVDSVKSYIAGLGLLEAVQLLNQVIITHVTDDSDDF